MPARMGSAMDAGSSGKGPRPCGAHRGGLHRRALTLGALIAGTLLVPFTDGVRAESRATLAPAAGGAGGTSSLAGAGFGKRDRVRVSIGREVVATGRTGRRGSFRASFT